MTAASRRFAPASLALGLALVASLPAEAGGPFPARERRALGTATDYRPTMAVGGLAPSPMKGTFYPTPMMVVGGNGVSGGDGYTPMQYYGDRAMSLYGPFAALRPISAPVTVYSRGYDGIVLPSVGNTTSYPFLPAAGAVVYPTRRNERGSFGYQMTPPTWDGGFNWVDFR